jgi:putative oxidoreductase
MSMASSRGLAVHPSLALTLLRVVTGSLVAPHGIRKLLAGPAGAIGNAIASHGIPMPDLVAWLVTLGELSGILLALGIATRAAGLAIALTMASFVVFVHPALFAQLGTGAGVQLEYPLLLMFLGLFFAALGPTQWSISLKR